MEQGVPQSDGIGYHDKGDPHFLDALADSMAKDITMSLSEPKVIVTIPAHNEEHHIENCLESLANQLTVFGNHVYANDFEILVLCHNCTDRTLQLCLQFNYDHPNLNLSVLQTDHPEVNNVGAVRRILMRIARSRISVPWGYIATTDADTEIHPYWLANLLGYVGSDYAMICGRIEIDVEGLTCHAKKILEYKRQYAELQSFLRTRMVGDRRNPAPSHSDNSGPNMAVRADVYDSVGGMPPIGFCEDIAFYDSVLWGGHSIRHCPLTIVTTSGRTDPRAPWGFGAELGLWNDATDVFFEVEGLEALLERFIIYGLMIEYVASSSTETLRSISKRSGIGKHRLLKYLKKYATQNALLHKLEKELDSLPNWRKRYPKKVVSQACQEIKNYLSMVPEDLSRAFSPDL